MLRVIVFALAAPIQLAAAAVGFVSALVLGLLSALVAGRLVERRSFGGVAASATAVLGSGVVGEIVVGVSSFAANILAEAVRGSG